MSLKPAPVPPRFTKTKPVVRFPHSGLKKLNPKNLTPTQIAVQLIALRKKES